jgi:hypothetical protein
MKEGFQRTEDIGLSFNYSPDLVMLVDHATRKMTCMAG